MNILILLVILCYNIVHMAGIYVHIPFCKTRCIYCGFYSTTHHELQERYVDAVLKEFEERKDYLTEPVETIYLGGGTPSQLSISSLRKLFNGILPNRGMDLPYYYIKEVTVECNPDDVTPELAEELVSLGVNRVSMGVQSFDDDRLHFIRRRHSAVQAKEAVNILRKAGVNNISIDLMFGFPGETLEDWEHDLNEAIKLNVEHISAYSLMYEEGTPLYSMLEKGEIKEVDEELSRLMYYRLIDILTEAGYEHYEISNFARPGYRSRHNSSYWKGVPYLGLGAGAHSYNIDTRSFNTDTIPEWHQEIEELDEITRYNDLITTALRTKEGINTSETIPQYLWDYLYEQAQPLVEKGLLAINEKGLHLTREGLYVSDDVMSELIFVQD